MYNFIKENNLIFFSDTPNRAPSSTPNSSEKKESPTKSTEDSLKQISEDIALISFHKKKLIKLKSAGSNLEQDAIKKSQEKIYFATKNVADKLYRAEVLGIVSMEDQREVSRSAMIRMEKISKLREVYTYIDSLKATDYEKLPIITQEGSSIKVKLPKEEIRYTGQDDERHTLKSEETILINFDNNKETIKTETVSRFEDEKTINYKERIKSLTEISELKSELENWDSQRPNRNDEQYKGLSKQEAEDAYKDDLSSWLKQKETMANLIEEETRESLYEIIQLIGDLTDKQLDQFLIDGQIKEEHKEAQAVMELLKEWEDNMVSKYEKNPNLPLDIKDFPVITDNWNKDLKGFKEEEVKIIYSTKKEKGKYGSKSKKTTTSRKKKVEKDIPTRVFSIQYTTPDGTKKSIIITFESGGKKDESGEVTQELLVHSSMEGENRSIAYHKQRIEKDRLEKEAEAAYAAADAINIPSANDVQLAQVNEEDFGEPKTTVISRYLDSRALEKEFKKNSKKDSTDDVAFNNDDDE